LLLQGVIFRIVVYLLGQTVETTKKER